MNQKLKTEFISSLLILLIIAPAVMSGLYRRLVRTSESIYYFNLSFSIGNRPFSKYRQKSFISLNEMVDFAFPIHFFQRHKTEINFDKTK